MTIKEFCIRHIIVANSVRIPNRPDGEWEGQRDALHWNVELSNRAGSYTCTYSHGSAIGVNALKSKVMGRKVYEHPAAADVLSCVRLDCECGSHPTFEDYAEECVQDADSRKAETSYRACQETARRVRAWLGREIYAELLACEPD
jgi:hypothetical protein